MRLFVGDDWAEDHHDIEVMDGAGRRPAKARLPEGMPVMTRLPAIVGEPIGDDPARHASAKARKIYAGTSRITRASGKKKATLTRCVLNDRLIGALLTRAFSTLRVSPNAHAYYQRQRARGGSHNAALRQLANRLVGSRVRGTGGRPAPEGVGVDDGDPAACRHLGSPVDCSEGHARRPRRWEVTGRGAAGRRR
ncbi:hypothetical protein [Streptomyces malaysiensis]|uniref:hypothetical protein n=1 Tax=Streptomyces malaysiensis TaxID=92644 RepID=UPI0037121FC5